MDLMAGREFGHSEDNSGEGNCFADISSKIISPFRVSVKVNTVNYCNIN